jgi:hypothetical protein
VCSILTSDAKRRGSSTALIFPLRRRQSRHLRSL